MIRVLDPGVLATVQDAGRPGHARSGVPRGGAADPLAYAAAIALVGADSAIEVAGARASFECDVASIVAVTGVDASLRIGARRVPGAMAAFARAREEIRVVPGERTRYAYLAVSGRSGLPAVLGSRATYLPAALGPIPRGLAAGDELPLGDPTFGIERAGTRCAMPRDDGPVATLRGPHAALFADADALYRETFEVDAASDRMGTRLRGSPIAAPARDILTCGIARGAVQIPRGGAPIVLGADHQTTGGYPIVACVATVDHGRVAQARPGDRIAFTEIDAARAAALLRAAWAPIAALR